MITSLFIYCFLLFGYLYTYLWMWSLIIAFFILRLFIPVLTNRRIFLFKSILKANYSRKNFFFEICIFEFLHLFLLSTVLNSLFKLSSSYLAISNKFLSNLLRVFFVVQPAIIFRIFIWTVCLEAPSYQWRLSRWLLFS